MDAASNSIVTRATGELDEEDDGPGLNALNGEKIEDLIGYVLSELPAPVVIVYPDMNVVVHATGGSFAMDRSINASGTGCVRELDEIIAFWP